MSYRQQFEKRFDFLTFNKELTLSQGSGRYAVAFDPSYVTKSGKKRFFVTFDAVLSGFGQNIWIVPVYDPAKRLAGIPKLL